MLRDNVLYVESLHGSVQASLVVFALGTGFPFESAYVLEEPMKNYRVLLQQEHKMICGLMRIQPPF